MFNNNGDMQHQGNDGVILYGTQLDSNNFNDNIVLSEEDITALSQMRTQGIPPERLVPINRLLANASREGNFSAFFSEILAFLKCGKKKKIKQNCQFLVYQDKVGCYSIVENIKSIYSCHAIEGEVLEGHLYVCDLGSLGLVFPDDSIDKEGFLKSIFSSTFGKQESRISKFAITCFSDGNINYQVVDYKKTSLQYALECEDVHAINIIYHSFTKLKEHDDVLQKVTESALLKVIQQQDIVSNAFLECVNCLLGFKTEGFDLNAEKNKSLVENLKNFTRVIRNNDKLLSRVCKGSYENIVKFICLIGLEELKRADQDYSGDGALRIHHRRMLGMSFGPDHDSILSILVQSDSVHLLKDVLSQHRFNINATNAYGYTVLHFAAIYNAKKCAKFLLGSRSKIIPKPAKSGLTPLHLAAGSNDSLDVLKLLIQYDPFAIHARDNMGRTIMHHAALGGSIDNLLLCINLGMDVNLQATVFNDDGEIDELTNTGRSCAPIHLAIEEGKLGIVSCLLSCCDINLSVVNSDGCTPITTVDHRGNNLLHQCVIAGNVELLSRALYLGWQDVILQENCEGKTAFDIAIQDNKIACAELLLPVLRNKLKYTEYGLQKIFENIDSNGNNLLHQAVATRRISLVKKILSCYNINLMSVNANKETALDIAIKTGSAEIVALLLADSRQSLVSRNGSSYVMKLMNKNLMTKEVCHIVKKRGVNRENSKYAKLFVSLMTVFVLITFIVIATIIECEKIIYEILNAIGKNGYTSICLIAIAVFILSIICISCCLCAKLRVKLSESGKLLKIEESSACTIIPSESSDSASEYIDTCEEHTPSASLPSIECEEQTLPPSIGDDKPTIPKPRKLTRIMSLEECCVPKPTLAFPQ
ncbi:ankyrin repeat protein [Ehrlichia chaffeensis str. Arkansas]|uniref:Ankyrin repeat protein n=1 Tax=Ehrlichia chaffeensis (strain ATCC CRL-10679 / Arkansas) TaxID=205920 RepID=Q2GFW1_EHRCR|nr:ankyrin repeat domain-containing protein [Ehrlichia chaffeensis]ABD44910.1 ankyrin repeat protein [Ehrlichia chaffeensis str. Arkansas]AHX07957.1 ankyrin repeat family protein [Ehrlichia chaffeensis str. Osceola]